MENLVLECLRGCYDPGSPVGKPANIVELGCVDSMQLTPDPDAPGSGIAGVPPRFRLLLTVLPTSSDADARAQLTAQIGNALAGVPQLSRTEVRLAEGWTLERIPRDVRIRLKLESAPFPILNNRRP